MKTIVNKIQIDGSIKEMACYVNEFSAQRNLENFFITNMRKADVFCLDEREKAKALITVGDSGRICMLQWGVDMYTAFARSDNGNIMPATHGRDKSKFDYWRKDFKGL